MMKVLSKWSLLPAFALSIGALGLAPGTAMAASCGGTDPIRLQISVGSQLLTMGDALGLKAQVTNCSGAEWNGTVQFGFTFGLGSPGCTNELPDFTGALRLKAGETRTVSYKATPRCFGQYVISGQAFNSDTQADASAWFTLGQKTRRH